MYFDYEDSALDDHDPECCHCGEHFGARSASPAPSVYSFSSSRDGHMLRELHGRTLNALCETYMLPADDTEFQRLNRAHELWKLQLGALTMAPDLVDQILAPQEGVQRRVLDLGTGTGVWLTDMAQKYPWVEYVGVDLAPSIGLRGSKTENPLPPNIRVEIDDINLDLKHYNQSFDLVHARFIGPGITDYRRLLKEIAQVLRPGGMVMLLEPDWELYDENGDAIEPIFEDKSSGSWHARVLFESYGAFRRCGGSLEAGLMLQRWLDEVEEFEEPQVEQIFLPIGQWMTAMTEEETRRLREIGEMTRQDALGLMLSLRPMLLADGFFEKAADMMLGRGRYELSEASLQHTGIRTLLKWHGGYARKKCQ